MMISGKIETKHISSTFPQKLLISLETPNWLHDHVVRSSYLALLWKDLPISSKCAVLCSAFVRPIYETMRK